MTPKEKAVELIEKFTNPTKDIHGNSYQSNRKKCAIIAVNEIIEQWEYIDTYLADGRGELNPNLKYWYEVKKEITYYKLV